MTQQTLTPPPLAPPGENWPEQGHWTYQDWLRLPDDGCRYEVLDGVLYMAPPPGASTHQRRAGRLFNWMRNFAEAHRLGEIWIAPTGVRLPGQPVPLQPDIFFIAAGRTDVVVADYVEGAPDLVVEVLSPSNSDYDRRKKYRAYQKAGVREYWIVDPMAKAIEVYVLTGRRYRLQGKWGPGELARSQVLAGFDVATKDLFA